MKAPKIPNWRGIQPALTLTGSGVTPPASVTFLTTGDQLTLSVGLTYAQPALMFEANTAASGTERRIGLVIGPAAQHGRCHLTRCTEAAYVGAQAAATVGSATGGFGTNDVATVPSGMTGAECYMDTGTAPGSVAVVLSGDKVTASPAVPGDRAIPLPEGLAPSIEEIEVNNVAGFGLSVVFWSPDLEAI